MVVAAYWHPLKLAGEVGMIDLLTGGRFEFGIGKGAYQREFDRMANGIDQSLGVPMMQEMLPVLKGLWRGDYQHDGEYWSFPAATACPKPVQDPHPPIWVAARDPGTYDWAARNGCDIMSWALTRPFSEVETYKERFETALANNPGRARPRFMTMRFTGVYAKPEESEVFIDAIVAQGRQFENLFRNLSPVVNGFPRTGRSRAPRQPGGIRAREPAPQPHPRHPREGYRQAQALRGAGGGFLLLLRQLRPAHGRAEEVAAPLHRRGHAGLPRGGGHRNRRPVTRGAGSKVAFADDRRQT